MIALSLASSLYAHGSAVSATATHMSAFLRHRLRQLAMLCTAACGDKQPTAAVQFTGLRRHGQEVASLSVRHSDIRNSALRLTGGRVIACTAADRNR